MPSETRISGAPKRRMSIRLPYRWPSLTSIEKKLGVKNTFSTSSRARTASGHNRRPPS
ncbi:hypothetical protein [Nonomuraea rubra]|uniref:hypothetical protein n=1 Tax=Nonomuraea rubra TaxID=46180 RepID=UPI0031E92312